MSRPRLILGALAVAPGLLWLAGCATPSPSLSGVQREVAARGGPAVNWPQTVAARSETDAIVRELLTAGLTPESAARVAVLNSRTLRATYAELGVAQADLSAAGRLANPSLSASVRWPDHAPRGPNVELSLATELLDSLFLPLRQQLAGARLAQAEARVANYVLTLASEAQAAAYTVQAAQQLRATASAIVDTNAAAADLAQRQFDAGNIPRLEFLERQHASDSARLELLHADARVQAAREQLSRLLGLTAAQAGWTLAGELPEPPASDPAPDGLEAFALARRLDLSAAQTQITLARQALDLKRRTRLLPVTVGVDTERESTGGRLTGPHVGVTLPLFDQGQAEIARLTAEFARAEDEWAALQIAIASDTRAAAAALQSARTACEMLERTLVPQRQQMVRETLIAYNAMLRDTHAVLSAKEQEQLAVREATEARLAYWLARLDLTRALGGALPPAPVSNP